MISDPLAVRGRRLLLLVWILTLTASSLSLGQCPGQWVPGAGIPDVNGRVYALVRMPNGDVVAGGDFSIAGDVVANNIAAWDGTHWHSLGRGFDSYVRCLQVMPNGDLVAGGVFESADGIASSRIARWSGVSWQPIGSGLGGANFSDEVVALTVMPNGDLIAGGAFGVAGGLPANCISRWDGAAWTPLADGSRAPVYSLLVDSSGTLFASGGFSTDNGVTVHEIATWTGSAWSPLVPSVGLEPHYGFAYSMCKLPSGELLIGGAYNGLNSSVARWNGSYWTTLYSLQLAMDLAVTSTGDVLACSSDNTGPESSAVSRWNGSFWTHVGDGLSGVAFAMLPAADGRLLVGGHFAISREAHGFVVFDGSSWESVGNGTYGNIHAVLRLADDSIVAGGDFISIAGVASNHIARWDGVNWSPMGLGITGTVRALAQLPSGEVVAAGEVPRAGGTDGQISRWDGSSWTSMSNWIAGPSPGASVHALAVAPNGDLYAGGTFIYIDEGVISRRVARWHKGTWSRVGTAAPNDTPGLVNALIVLDNGDLVAGGTFPSITGVLASNIARWNGTTWSAFGSGITGTAVNTLCQVGGDLYAGGDFTDAGGSGAHFLARWDGASWSGLGTGVDAPVRALYPHPQGGLAVGGSFTHAGGVSAGRLARWDGAAWSATAGPLDGDVESLAAGVGADLLVGGSFYIAGEHVSRSFAHLVFPSADYDHDGSLGTDADIQAFFACLSGNCCSSCTDDFNGDGDVGTDLDIDAFFRVLAGGSC